ncbi:MAG: MlaD family protein [Kiritimatiellaeota bacterium]|nr:MlaD family protein [Kiritimatiellota bacterium]
MMDKTFKFRFVNEITGAFVLLAIAVLIAGIFLAGRAQGLFEPKFRLHTVFQAEEGTYGLKKGSEVRIRDTVAGNVIRINPTMEGTIEATFELKASFHGFVRTNSVAVVKKTLIVAGDSFVDISIGNRQFPLMPDGSLIACTLDKDITKQALLVLEELRARLLPTLEKVNAVLDELPALTVQTRNTLHESEVLLHENVPGLLIQAQDTLRSSQVLIEGLQQHWPFRKSIENPEPGPLISPANLTLEPAKQTGGESK